MMMKYLHRTTKVFVKCTFSSTRLATGEEYIRRHTVLNADWSSELTRRRELIDRGFKLLSPVNIDAFKTFGVGTLVIDKSVPYFTSMSFPGGVSTVFENETFIILKIG